MFKRFRNHLISGLLIFLPVVISLYIMSFLFVKTTDYIFHLFPAIYHNNFEIRLFIRIIALLLLLSSLILLGMLAKILLIKKLLRFGESVFLRIPLLGKIYNAIKQVSEAFLGYDKTILNKVCMIEFPRKGSYSIGFVTSTAQGEIQYKTQAKVINVFVPTTPNPTTGFLIIVPENEVVVLDMTIEEGLKLVISGGAVVPDYIPKPGVKKI